MLFRVEVLQTRLAGALQRINDLQHNEEVVNNKFSVMIKSIEDIKSQKANEQEESSRNKRINTRVDQLEKDLISTGAQVVCI